MIKMKNFTQTLATLDNEVVINGLSCHVSDEVCTQIMRLCGYEPKGVGSKEPMSKGKTEPKVKAKAKATQTKSEFDRDKYIATARKLGVAKKKDDGSYYVAKSDRAQVYKAMGL